jgi:hypothetical protein
MVKATGHGYPSPGGDSTQSDFCQAVTADDSGNVHCAGYTNGSIGEGNGGLSDAVVIKFDSTGSIIWSRQLGNKSTVPDGSTSQNDKCMSVAIDADKNVY